jgi:acetyl esterase/lipase
VSQGGPSYAFKPTAGESLVPTKRCRPDFAIALYPGHICRSGTTFDPGIKVTRQTPPTFLLQAWDDPVEKICNGTLYARALDDAGVPAEVHFFAKGGHAFGHTHILSPPGPRSWKIGSRPSESPQPRPDHPPAQVHRCVHGC